MTNRIPRRRARTASRSSRRAPVYNVYMQNCPTRRVLAILANKWTSLVIVALRPGTKRFQQLRREIDGVSQKMLTQTLRTLEQDGLVKRVPYPTIPPKVEYSLTALGRTLTEPLAALHLWSEAHVEEIEAARKAHVPFLTQASRRAEYRKPAAQVVRRNANEVRSSLS